MSNLEIELQDLRDRNNELSKSCQHWKMTAAQRENEKLELMKENNDLRLKLSRLQRSGTAHIRKLDAEIEAAGKLALSHLVQASNSITRTVQLVKNYVQDTQELETTLPRWSTINNTPNSDKVHRVPPLMIGGQSIQPVVSLSRTIFNVNNSRTNRTSNNRQSHNFPERALPLHLLQDLYIPLTRIDANSLTDNNIIETNANDANNSVEALGLDDNEEQLEEEAQNASNSEEFDHTLEVVTEESEEEPPHPTPRARSENPLEGPSWMLDSQNNEQRASGRSTLEPDSTTDFDRQLESPQQVQRVPAPSPLLAPRCAFTPTVRRRKRAKTPSPTPTPTLVLPTPSPRVPHRRTSNSGKVLKVLLSKLQLDGTTPPRRAALAHAQAASESPQAHESDEPPSPPRRDDSPEERAGDRRGDREDSKGQGRSTLRVEREALASPARRLAQCLSFDAPSPNGATTTHLIVSETTEPLDEGGSGEPAAAARRRPSHAHSRDSRSRSRDGRASRDAKRSRDAKQESAEGGDSDGNGDAVAGRSRRARKAVVYKEKPLNKKMRR